MCKGTYSPKIRDDLISILYQLAKRKRVPMTRLVNEIIEDYLRQMEGALLEMKEREIAGCLLERGAKWESETISPKRRLQPMI